MRVFVLLSNQIGEKVIKHLILVNDKVVGIGLPKNQKINPKFNTLINKHKIKKFYLDKKINNDFLKKFKLLNIDLMLSVYWPYILKENFFLIPKNGTINFHLSFLPFNRGKNPNVWPIIEGTPAGVSIHRMNKKIDQGEIICQSFVKVEIIDDAESVFRKLVKQINKLFISNWENIKNNKINLIKQNLKSGSTHNSKDFDNLSNINLNKKIYPLELINILRAKSFSKKEPAYFYHDGKKIFLSIKMEYEKE